MTPLHDQELSRLLSVRSHNPHELLGRHRSGNLETLRVFLPHAQEAWVMSRERPMSRYQDSALFIWQGAPDSLPPDYRLLWTDDSGHWYEQHDPYAFAPSLTETDLQRFNAGHHYQAADFLGAHVMAIDGVRGTRFAVWAPNAERVSVVGDFNRWDGRAHPMCVHGRSDVWELFIPGVDQGMLYKFEVRDADRGVLAFRTDPCGRYFEPRPGRAAIVIGPSSYAWDDQDWLANRSDWQRRPISIYELHLGSWQRGESGEFLNYRELADELLPYVQRLGMTHLEVMPVTEHLLDASWGFQPTGYFAPTSRYGEPDDLRYFVDRFHQAGIGIYLDWVPGPLTADDFAMVSVEADAREDCPDPNRDTPAFDYGSPEVCSLLYSSALYWLQAFHFDGLRVDGVVSMLYLDTAPPPDRWRPNLLGGGGEDLETAAFLRRLNTLARAECPGTVTLAGESTDWSGVTAPLESGGLGFSMKWNMSWMHDTLAYMRLEPAQRRYHHRELTFGLRYAFDENFVLPLSHDEVAHARRSLYGKMPGDSWQKFANLRLLYSYQFTYPGKKLMFMGAELANPCEWNDQVALPRFLLDQPEHQGVATLVSDLNRLYRGEPALHRYDFFPVGFAWTDCNDAERSIIAYRRCHDRNELLVVLNFTPELRGDYRIGVARPGYYRELLNSDAAIYGGSNVGNLGGVCSEPVACMGQGHSLVLMLPPLGALVLKREEPV